MTPTGARARIHDLVTAVPPLDGREVKDRATILEWVASGASLFRIEKPSAAPGRRSRAGWRYERPAPMVAMPCLVACEQRRRDGRRGRGNRAELTLSRYP